MVHSCGLLAGPVVKQFDKLVALLPKSANVPQLASLPSVWSESHR